MAMLLNTLLIEKACDDNVLMYFQIATEQCCICHETIYFLQVSPRSKHIGINCNSTTNQTFNNPISVEKRLELSKQDRSVTRL